MNPDLLILSATQPEVAGFVSFCPETSTHTMKTGHHVRSGRVGEQSYDLLITGPGVFNLSYAFAAYLNESVPKTIICAGIAGVFKASGFGIGDMAMATQEHYLHTGVQAEGIKKDPLPFDLIDRHPLSRQGIYPLDEQKTDYFYKKISAQCSGEYPVRIFKGPFLTVSMVTSCFDHADALYEEYGAVMESMEGAACAHIAACCGLPLVQIRSASNFVGERNKTRWDIKTAVNNLGRALASI